MGQNIYYRYVTLWEETLQTDGAEPLLQVCNIVVDKPAIICTFGKEFPDDSTDVTSG